MGTIIVIVGTIHIISDLIFFSFELTALILIVTWFFCNGGTLVWAFRSSAVGLVASQCLLAFHLGLPNHLVPPPFQDATKSVHMCHSPNAPG